MFALTAAGRTAQIKRSQDRYLNRLLTDPRFAVQQSVLPHHACLGTRLNPSQGRDLLELGCGPGRYVAMLMSMGFSVTGVDPFSFDTWAAIEAAGAATLKHGVYAEDLPFGDASFDALCCLGALLYFTSPEQAIREMCRVLKPGGRLVLRTVNRENLYTRRTGMNIDPSSKNLLGKRELIELVEAGGFRIHEYFSFGYFPSLFPGLYWYLQNVWLGNGVQQQLSDRLPEAWRVNHVIHASRP